MTKKKSRFGSNVVSDVERRENMGSTYGYLNLPKGMKMFKETSGKIKVDIIPYVVTDTHHMDGNPDDDNAANPGNPWYKKPAWVHRGIGADNTSVVCPKTKGLKCPICEHRNKQVQSGVDKESLVGKSQLRNIYVVVPIGHKNYEEKFHIWDISNNNFQKELDEELRENPDKGVFPDPEQGLTLSIRFSEEVFGKHKFLEASRIDFEERSEAYDESVMDKAPKLDDILKILSYKELENMFLEISDEDTADDTPKKRKSEEDDNDISSLKKKKPLEDDSPRKRKPEPEEEEEDSPRKGGKPKEEEDEPWEKGGPSRKKKSLKSPEPEEEEEEEEERPKKKKVVEEEEEEEDKPLRRRSQKEPEEEEEEEERPKKRKVVDEEEEEEDDQPQKKKRSL